MNVIIHADDFGYDKETVKATIDLFELGALTSASIMVNMPASEDSMAFAASHKQYSFGLHLTYVDGLRPVWQNIQSSLLNKAGVFYPSNDVRKKAMCFALKKEDIVEESMAQINLLKSAGVEISHLDSHGHLHKFPSFLAALQEVKHRSGIERVRRVQNVFIKKQRLSLTTLFNCYFNRQIVRTCRTTDYFYMSANSMDTGWADAIINQMDKLPEQAVIEIGVHPGCAKDEDERWRAHEYQDVLEFAEKIRSHRKHQMITWREV